MSEASSGGVRLRLHIFDGLRGHLLIGMLIAHLSFQPGLDWLGNFHHHRILKVYDAGFFVLIAGLLVGHLWSHYYSSYQARRRFLRKRLLTIYRYYILSALPFFVATVAAHAGFFASALGVLTMQIGGWYSDILPIYFVCFVLLVPFAVIPALDRPWLIIGLSALIYAAAQFTNLSGFFGFSSDFVVFDIAAWQFLFISAILVGRRIFEVHSLIVRANPVVISVILAALVAMSLVLRQNTYYPDPLDPIQSLSGVQPRMGLHPFFYVKIVFLAIGFSIIMIRKDRWLSPLHKLGHWYFSLSFIKNVGKYSIQMYLLHVYIMAAFKIGFVDASAPVKITFAISSIAIFIALPNLWVRFRPGMKPQGIDVVPQTNPIDLTTKPLP